jgi:HK97 gp10 family phage protein
VAEQGNAVSVDVDDRQLKRQLDRLKGTVASDKTIRNALTSAARPMRNDAKDRAPEDTGELKRSIRIRTRKVADYGYRAFVAARTYYAHLVEFGVAPHYIKRKKGRGRRRVLHPGHAAQPFLRPAFDTKKDDSVRIARDRLRKAIAKVTRGTP